MIEDENRSTPLIEVEINHLVKEHVQAERLYYARHSKFASVDRVVALLLLTVGIVTTYLVGLKWWTAIWFLLAPLEFFDLLSIAPIVVAARFKKTDKFHELNKIVFSEEGIHFTTPTIDSKLKWETYNDLCEDDELILLIYGSHMYTVLPKRCFNSDQDIANLLDLARRRISSATV